MVPAILGARWYDDGPRDLTGASDVYAPDGPLIEALRSCPVDQVVQAIAAHTELNEATLPVLLELSIFAARPQLVLALLPIVHRHENLPATALITAAAYAFEAGALDAAASLVSWPQVRRFLMTPCPECGHGCYPQQNDQNLNRVARSHPGLLLGILRELERKSLRWRAAGVEAMQLRARATALELLHRPVQAERAKARAIALTP